MEKDFLKNFKLEILDPNVKKKKRLCIIKTLNNYKYYKYNKVFGINFYCIVGFYMDNTHIS